MKEKKQGNQGKDLKKYLTDRQVYYIFRNQNDDGFIYIPYEYGKKSFAFQGFLFSFRMKEFEESTINELMKLFRR